MSLSRVVFLVRPDLNCISRLIASDLLATSSKYISLTGRLCRVELT